MKPGPRTQEQLKRLSQTWKQGEHMLISGATGSGKTALARHVDQVRINAGGHVVVMVCKLQPDETIMSDYKGWTRWKTWKKNPSRHDKRILLWPDTDKARNAKGKWDTDAALDMQHEVFTDAFNKLARIGKWNLHVDEGLYVCSPAYLNMGKQLGMLHALGRSSKLTITTLVQRPSHVPLIIYSSASHAMIGRARENVDLKRLAEMGGRESAKSLAARIDAQERHEFLWVPVAPDWPAETVNLAK